MAENNTTLKIISGSTHNSFAKSVAERVKLKLTEVEVSRHSDSETYFEIKESIRDKHIFIIQSKNCDINDNIMELLIMIHTCKLASSRRITAAISYFPYSRQDKKLKSRSPISAKLIANLLERAGADHIITMDLHSPQIQGFFNIPVDNLFAEPSILKYIKQYINEWKTAVIVSPDAGGATRATSIASKLHLDFALIHKQKKCSNKRQSLTLVGDVSERLAIIIDDLTDTFDTILKAVNKLKEMNASKVYAIVTHGILSGQSSQLVNNSQLERLVVTNTIQQTEHQKHCKKLSIIDVSPVFGEAIRRTHEGKSVSYLFTHTPPIV